MEASELSMTEAEWELLSKPIKRIIERINIVLREEDSMAHADYNCCAICDTRMEYSDEAEKKTDLCASCAVEFYKATGLKCLTAECLIDWMRSTPDAKRILDELGFSACHYDNAVDAEYATWAQFERAE